MSFNSKNQDQDDDDIPYKCLYDRIEGPPDIFHARRTIEALQFLLEPEILRIFQEHAIPQVCEIRDQAFIDRVRQNCEWELREYDEESLRANPRRAARYSSLIEGRDAAITDRLTHSSSPYSDLLPFIASFNITPQTPVSSVLQFLERVQWFFDTDVSNHSMEISSRHGWMRIKDYLDWDWARMRDYLASVHYPGIFNVDENITMGEALRLMEAYVGLGVGELDSNGEGEMALPEVSPGQDNDSVDLIFPPSPVSMELHSDLSPFLGLVSG